MKFAVVVATRGRPKQAKTVLDSARMLSSGKHEVEYIVAFDDDDLESKLADWTGIRQSMAPRPLGPGACWNRCIGFTDADVLVALPDDTIVGTAGWDDLIYENFIVRKPALCVLAWNDSASPGQATNIIAHREWLTQIGYLYDERFPFWFSDTAVSELFSFVTGEHIPQPEQLRLIHNGSSSNPRLRDMDLWWRLYGATRKERLDTAERIRSDLQLTPPANLAAMTRMWEDRDVAGLPLSEQIVAQMPNPKPADDHYGKAKANAITYLKEHGLPVEVTRQTICLSMIVKDEETVIVRCLESLKPLIDRWAIIDTGSSDKTVEVIKECMKDIPGLIVERPWVNFAHNRTQALGLAREQGCDFILTMDADDVVQLDEGFAMPRLTCDSYQVSISLNGNTYSRPQLLKSKTPWIYKGVVHEHVWCYEEGSDTKHVECTQGVLSGLTIIAGHDGARRKGDAKARFEADAALIEAELPTEKDPAWQSRYTFYLAQSYRDAGNLTKAAENYLKRASLGGWREETYISLLEAARCLIQLEADHDSIIETLGWASAVVPQRSEGWCVHAQYLRSKAMYNDAFYVAARGLLVREPPPMGLFCEPEAYSWRLVDEFAVSAFHSGRYRECREGCEALLAGKALPADHRERVGQNLKFATDKLAEAA